MQHCWYFKSGGIKSQEKKGIGERQVWAVRKPKLAIAACGLLSTGSGVDSRLYHRKTNYSEAVQEMGMEAESNTPCQIIVKVTMIRLFAAAPNKRM